MRLKPVLTRLAFFIFGLSSVGCASMQARRAGDEAAHLELATADPFTIVDQIELYDGDLRYLDLRRCAVVLIRLAERAEEHERSGQAIEAQRARFRQIQDSLTRASGRINKFDSAAVNRYNAALAAHSADVSSANATVTRANEELSRTEALQERMKARCSGRRVKDGHLKKLPAAEREALDWFIIRNVRGVRP
jgi:hypothetical protein